MTTEQTTTATTIADVLHATLSAIVDEHAPNQRKGYGWNITRAFDALDTYRLEKEQGWDEEAEVSLAKAVSSTAKAARAFPVTDDQIAQHL